MENEKSEFTKDTVDMIGSYKKLCGTILEFKERIQSAWNKLMIIKPKIFFTAYNPSNNFIGIGFKSDQAYLKNIKLYLLDLWECMHLKKIRNILIIICK